jgi:hypothetical protein
MVECKECVKEYVRKKTDINLEIKIKHGMSKKLVQQIFNKVPCFVFLKTLKKATKKYPITVLQKQQCKMKTN